MEEKAKYNTWIRFYKLLLFCFISVLLVVIGIVVQNIYITILFVLVALPFIYITLILSYSYFQFSSRGGNFQSKIHDLIVKELSIQGSGKILDIGAGSGSLIIKVARKYQNTQLVGVDYWGKDWEYSKDQCIKNATIEGVNNRIDFIKASAAQLPFENNTFDAVISCLTFHEVKDEKNKILLIKEALRIIKPGSTFVFLDLFKDKKIFGEYTNFKDSIRELNIEQVEFQDLHLLIQLPKLLLQGKILGNAVIIKGKK